MVVRLPINPATLFLNKTYLRTEAKYFIIIFLILTACCVQGQNRNAKWYFGLGAGLDFMNNPPSVLTGSTTNGGGDCASIANTGGSLLFYTDGNTVYNQTHAVMANGLGLNGNPIGVNQPAFIAKQPGNANIFYVLTNNSIAQFSFTNTGVYYSVVDMNLAAGMGSVTIKNVLLCPPPVSDALTCVKHCNGSDIWIVSHDLYSNVF